MILVDYREGSKDLLAPLEARGVEVAETDICADVEFVGRGEGGKSVDVGIEYKKLSELIDSMRSGRLQSIQCPRMQEAYAFRYLLIEGEVLYDTKGRLLRRKGRRFFEPLPGGMTVGELYKRLFVLHLQYGMNWHIVKGQRDTITYLEILYRTWTDCDLDEHKSHMAAFTPPRVVPLSDFRDVVERFPGVGTKVSAEAEKLFGGSIRRAVNSASSWAEIKTRDKRGHERRFGAAHAEELERFLK